jgi:tetratricopeptide (TPR) repeat protein
MALTDLNKAIELQPSDSANFYVRAKIWEILSENIKALKDYEKAIQLRPHLAILYEARASLCFKLSKWNCVINDMTKLTEISKDNKGYYYYKRALSHDISKNIEDAIADYKKALEFGFESSAVYGNLGSCFENIKDFDKALENYEKALTINPNGGITYYKVARVYCQKNEIAKALKYLELAILKDKKILQYFNLEDPRWNNFRNSEIDLKKLHRHNG